MEQNGTNGAVGLTAGTGRNQEGEGLKLPLSYGAMNNFFTLFIMPMFYVSGVFFPLDHLPQSVRMLSWALPLTPAAALVRGLVTGNTTWLMVLWALELMAFAIVGLWLASLFMRRRLIR